MCKMGRTIIKMLRRQRSIEGFNGNFADMGYRLHDVVIAKILLSGALSLSYCIVYNKLVEFTVSQDGGRAMLWRRCRLLRLCRRDFESLPLFLQQVLMRRLGRAVFLRLLCGRCRIRRARSRENPHSLLFRRARPACRRVLHLFGIPL